MLPPDPQPSERVRGAGVRASCYFTVGRIGRDQAEDYARRRGIPLRQAEHWLRPNLGYEPEGEDEAPNGRLARSRSG